MFQGASMVSWTTRNPCLVLNESDSKLYTKFKFCEDSVENIQKHINLHNQASYDDKKIPRKVYIF